MKARCRLSQICLLFAALLPAAVQAQLTFTTNSGAITITGYTGPGGAVVIPPATNGLPVTSIGTNAFQNVTSLGSLTIPSSVTNIGNFAFYGCFNLTAIYFQGNAPTNSGNLFQNAPTTNYYQPGTSGWSSFFGGRPAVMLNPPNPAGSLKVTLPLGLGGGNTAAARWQVDGGVTQPGGATVLGLSVGNHTISFGPLNGCAMPASQTIAVSANLTATSSGTYWPLTYATNNGAVTISGNSGNSRLGGDVVFPGTIDGLPVTSIGSYAFQGCGSLTNITTGSDVTSIGEYAFVNCNNLTNVTLSDSVTNIMPGAFNGCPRLTTFTVSPSNLFFSTMDGVLFNKNQTMLVKYPGGVGGSYLIPQSVTNIGDAAFAVCTSLTNVTISDSITRIGKNAFAACTGLGSVTMPNSVTHIWSYAFSGCTGLTNVAIGTSVATLENDAFYGCTGLTSIAIPDSVIGVADYVFYGCTNLTNATIGANLFSIYGIMFPNCPSLTGIYFRGNAPILAGYGYLLSPDSTATVYYLPGAVNWPAPGEVFGGLPTALWLPQVRTSDASFGVLSNQFGFNITWASDTVVVVEACSDLVNPDWTPVGTNTIADGSSYFSDPDWMNYSARFYRLRWP